MRMKTEFIIQFVTKVMIKDLYNAETTALEAIDYAETVWAALEQRGIV